jgi:endonuclease/exonuclease/phosphatase family metal-dependent hydrolase
MTPPPRKPGNTSRVLRGIFWFLAGWLILSGWSCNNPEEKRPDSTQLEQPAEVPTPPGNEQDKIRDASPRLTENAPQVRFVSYNVLNWLTMERFEDRKPVGKSPKPDTEKKQVIRILTEIRPDILGLCEIGSKKDLEEIQSLLNQSGISLPHLYHSTGPDPVRSLGLLSRHPIVSTDSSAPLEYRLQGKTFGMGRGILDATIHADGLKLRFLGVHLKSKREVPEGDQEAMRVNEARLLRKHVDSIFQSAPQAPLVVYGDFNDTYPSTAVRTICSHPDPAFRLRPIYLRDSRREAWTHHWKPHDIYSRIDFVTTSETLRNRVDYNGSHIIDNTAWDQASDHRPLLVIFR